MSAQDLKDMKARLQKSLDMSKSTIAACNFIVRFDNGICIDPDVKNHEVAPGKIKTGMPDRVRRFTKGDAERIAANVKNGSGEQPKAITWKKATQMEIDQLGESIEFWENAIKNGFKG